VIFEMNVSKKYFKLNFVEWKVGYTFASRSKERGLGKGSEEFLKG